MKVKEKDYWIHKFEKLIRDLTSYKFDDDFIISILNEYEELIKKYKSFLQ